MHRHIYGIDFGTTKGSSSLVRPVQQIIHQKFGVAKVKSGDNFNSVAKGLVYSFGLFNSKSQITSTK